MERVICALKGIERDRRGLRGWGRVQRSGTLHPNPGDGPCNMGRAITHLVVMDSKILKWYLMMTAKELSG